MARIAKPEDGQEMSLQEELLALKKELQEQIQAIKEQQQTQPVRAYKAPAVSKAWDETRSVYIPRGGMNEANYMIVGVNGRRYQVPKGKNVEVPLPLYERITLTLEAEERAYELRKKVQKQSEEQAKLKRMQ